MKPDPISTSPLAMQAFEVVKRLDILIGPAAAQEWMLRSNSEFGATPVQAIKERRIEDVLRAVRGIAMEKGLLREPWIPPERKKDAKFLRPR